MMIWQLNQLQSLGSSIYSAGTGSCSLQGMVEREGRVQLNFEEWVGFKYMDMG